MILRFQAPASPIKNPIQCYTEGMKKYPKNSSPTLSGPALDTVSIAFNEGTDFSQYPFTLPIIKNLTQINFPTKVTFFVGENGSGKSTILEAIAHHAGFGAEGGSKNINFKTSDERTYRGCQALADHITLSWNIIKPPNGYFFRAESFFNIANYIDMLARECAAAKKPMPPMAANHSMINPMVKAFSLFSKIAWVLAVFYIR
jgi:predicted ATPase